MKTKQFVWILVGLGLMANFGWAQSSERDATIDAKLDASALSGIAPPTGGPITAVAPAVSGQQNFVDPYLPALMQSGALVLGQSDGKGRVYEVKGNAYVTKRGNPVEVKVTQGMTVEAGDLLRTESGALLSVTFDENYKNAFQLPANSSARIESIEPTNVVIENGTLFSAVDGLPQGSTWKVSTPVAIAAVRGTLYLVRFQAASGEFFAATVNVPDDGKTSAIDIQQISGEANADIPEGKQITLVQGQVPDESLVKDLDPSILEEIMAFFENLIDLREENNNNVAPPTSGSGAFGEVGLIDPAGDGVVNRNNNPLDIQDTGVIDEPLPPVVEESSYGDGYGDYQYEGEYPPYGGDFNEQPPIDDFIPGDDLPEEPCVGNDCLG